MLLNKALPVSACPPLKSSGDHVIQYAANENDAPCVWRPRALLAFDKTNYATASFQCLKTGRGFIIVHLIIQPNRFSRAYKMCVRDMGMEIKWYSHSSRMNGIMFHKCVINEIPLNTVWNSREWVKSYLRLSFSLSLSLGPYVLVCKTARLHCSCLCGLRVPCQHARRSVEVGKVAARDKYQKCSD